MAHIEVIQTATGAAHAIDGRQVHEGDTLELWHEPEKTWVRGAYCASTKDGAFDERFAYLATDRLGTLGVFPRHKVRWPTEETAARRAGPKPRGVAPTIPSQGAYEAISIREQDVVLLQMTPALALDRIQDLVFEGFEAARSSRRAGSEWLALCRTSMPHYMGKTTWIAFSTSVPLPVLAQIQRALEAAGLGVEREMGRALRHKLSPFARLSDDGLEILVPAALAGDPRKRRTVQRGTAEPTARGYILEP